MWEQGREKVYAQTRFNDPSDGVAYALEDAQKVDTVQLASGQEIVLLEDIEFAH